MSVDATTTATPGRALNITLWVLQVLAAAMYAMVSVLKLSGDPQSVEGMNAIGLGHWFNYFIGAVELAAAIGLLVPVLSGLAAIGCTALMTGAVVITAIMLGGEMVVSPLIMLVVVAFIAWGRRYRTRRLFTLLRTRRGAAG